MAMQSERTQPSASISRNSPVAGLRPALEGRTRSTWYSWKEASFILWPFGIVTHCVDRKAGPMRSFS